MGRMVYPLRDISVTIRQDPIRVAAFAGDPQNLPRWAGGLAAGIKNVAGRWLTDSPMGTVEVRFTGDICHGVLDHDVIFADGQVVHNPLRVLRNGDGSEVVFTLYKLNHMSAQDFEQGAALVLEDLQRLRQILENGDLASGVLVSGDDGEHGQ